MTIAAHQATPRLTWKYSKHCCTMPAGVHPPKPKEANVGSPNAFNWFTNSSFMSKTGGGSGIGGMSGEDGKFSLGSIATAPKDKVPIPKCFLIATNALLVLCDLLFDILSLLNLFARIL